MTEKNAPTGETKTIPMNDRTKRFYQGVATGSRIQEEHAEVDFPDHATRVALFYFYAGVLAGVEHECHTSEDIEPFLLGLQTRAPQGSAWERRVLSAVSDWSDDEFLVAFGFEREEGA